MPLKLCSRRLRSHTISQIESPTLPSHYTEVQYVTRARYSPDDYHAEAVAPHSMCVRQLKSRSCPHPSPPRTSPPYHFAMWMN
jgi:hypothetical protein